MMFHCKTVSQHSQSHKTVPETIIPMWGNSHFLSTVFERFAESVQPPVCPSKVKWRRVTVKSFPLFGLNPVKTSQEARGLIRCGDTIAAGGVTRKPADRSLNITHASYDLPIRTSCWGVITALPPRPICLQSSFKMKSAHRRSLHTPRCLTTCSTCTHPNIHTATHKLALEVYLSQPLVPDEECLDFSDEVRENFNCQESFKRDVFADIYQIFWHTPDDKKTKKKIWSVMLDTKWHHSNERDSVVSISLLHFIFPACEENQTMGQMFHFSTHCQGNKQFHFACHCSRNDTALHSNPGSENLFHSTPDLCLWPLREKQSYNVLPKYQVANQAWDKETKVCYTFCMKEMHFCLFILSTIYSTSYINLHIRYKSEAHSYNVVIYPQTFNTSAKCVQIVVQTIYHNYYNNTPKYLKLG